MGNKRMSRKERLNKAIRDKVNMVFHEFRQMHVTRLDVAARMLEKCPYPEFIEILKNIED